MSALAAIGNLPPAQQPEKKREEERQYQAKLSSVERDLEKKRQDIENEFQMHREAVNRDSLRGRSEAEHVLITTLTQIETDRQQKRAALMAAREKIRKKGR